MRKAFLGLGGGAILFAFTAFPAHAECNATCRAKCEATAHRGNMTVAQCIREWSAINARHGKNAKSFEGRVGYSKDGKKRLLVREEDGSLKPMR